MRLCQQSVRTEAALGQLAPDIDFEEYSHMMAQAFRPPVDLFRQRQGIKGMHHIEEIEHIADFVTLQGANQMPLRGMPPQLANFVAGFLEVIFADNRHPSSDGGTDARRV